MAGYRAPMPQRGPDIYTGKDTMNPRVQLEELQREMQEQQQLTAIQQVLRTLMGRFSEGYDGRWAGETGPLRADSDDVRKENRAYDLRDPDDLYADEEEKDPNEDFPGS